MARANFAEHGLMYEPGNDPRVGGADSPEEIAIKQRIIAAFEAMRESPTTDHEAWWAVVRVGDRELYQRLRARHLAK